MPYSLDLRQRVIDFIENGGAITQASKLYKIGRATIYRWLNRENLAPTKVTRRQRKLDWQALAEDVRSNPEARLVDRAQKFGVSINAIHYALKTMKITRKKKSYVIAKEIEPRELLITDFSEN